MSFQYPGGNNTFVPTPALSGNLQVAFSRNPERFAVNKYIKLTPVRKNRGFYYYFNPLDLARFVAGATAGNKWAPGTLAPTGFHNQQGFELREYTAERYAFATTLDEMGVEQADWPVAKTHADKLAQDAMTNRAIKVATLLTTSGNYDSTHVATSTVASGGSGVMTGGTASDPRIHKALNYAAQIIQKDTLGRISYKDLSIVMNPATAISLAQTQEIHSYVQQSPYALDQIRGLTPNQNAMFGLPDRLYGMKLIVEDAVYSTKNKGSTSTSLTSYAFPDNYIAVVTREEDLESTEGAASYSSVHLFVNEDMKVEQQNDPWNRLLHMRVVDTFVEKFVAPVSAFLITNVSS